MNIIKSLSYHDIITLIRNSNDKANKNFKFIGKGGEGVVYKINNYAVKIYRQQNKQHKENNEIKILKKLNELLNKNITNNFIKIYDFVWIHNFDILVMELVNGDLEKWVKIKHSDTEWLIMIFQILYGLIVLQKYLKLYHSDMKPKNILFKKVNNGVYKYVINNDNNDKVASISFQTDTIFMIGDFGHAQMLTNSGEIMKYIENNSDLLQLSSFHRRLVVNMMENIYTLENLIEIGKKHKQFQKYFVWSKAKIDKDLKNFDEKTKNNMLFRSLAYYLIEYDYININDLPICEKDYSCLPSKKIIKILESLDGILGFDKLVDKTLEIGQLINTYNLENPIVFNLVQ